MRLRFVSLGLPAQAQIQRNMLKRLLCPQEWLIIVTIKMWTMIHALNVRLDADPMEVLENMRSAVDGFVLDAEQFDDLTMLCLEYKGNNSKKKG